MMNCHGINASAYKGNPQYAVYFGLERPRYFTRVFRAFVVVYKMAFASHLVYWVRTAAAASIAAAVPAIPADVQPFVRVGLVLASTALGDALATPGSSSSSKSVTLGRLWRTAATLLVLSSSNVAALCMLLQLQQLAMLDAGFADGGIVALTGAAGTVAFQLLRPDAFRAGLGMPPVSVLTAAEAAALLCAYVALRRGFGVNKYLLWAAAGSFQVAREPFLSGARAGQARP